MLQNANRLLSINSWKNLLCGLARPALEKLKVGSIRNPFEALGEAGYADKYCAAIDNCRSLIKVSMEEGVA